MAEIDSYGTLFRIKSCLSGLERAAEFVFHQDAAYVHAGSVGVEISRAPFSRTVGSCSVLKKL